MKTLIYDATIEGFLTSIFYCYEKDEFLSRVSSTATFQNNLLDEFIEISTDKIKAKRVKQGIIKKVGINLFNEINTVFCSDDQNKDNVLFDYLKLIFA
ncbi:MAG: DNA metabolism protein, partial [Clostridia bacterium]|nr:DNA metabolism protein [Clostridia bacterium]